MGSPESEWGHPAVAENRVNVTLTHAWVIGQHEVTQSDWVQHGLPNPSTMLKDGTGDCISPQCPVGNVTWFEAAAYTNLLSKEGNFPECYKLEGCAGAVGAGMTCASATLLAPTVYDCAGFRLPTQAEWEYAARAGTHTAFYSGDIRSYPTLSDCGPDPNLEKIAWYCHNSQGSTHPVMSKQPNGFGLFDTSGNAFEWAHDQVKPNGYGDGPLVDPFGDLVAVETRALRGGMYSLWSSLCRSAAFSTGFWNKRGPGIGFRVARTLPK
jgi:formylglycine-generating enzyme